MADRYEAVLSRLGELSHEIALLQLGLEELNVRFEGLGVLAALVKREDELKRKEGAGEDLVA